jgi:hypothetical protein
MKGVLIVDDQAIVVGVLRAFFSQFQHGHTYELTTVRVSAEIEPPQVAPGVSKEGRYLGIWPGLAPFGGFGGSRALGCREDAALGCS